MQRKPQTPRITKYALDNKSCVSCFLLMPARYRNRNRLCSSTPISQDRSSISLPLPAGFCSPPTPLYSTCSPAQPSSRMKRRESAYYNTSIISRPPFIPTIHHPRLRAAVAASHRGGSKVVTSYIIPARLDTAFILPTPPLLPSYLLTFFQPAVTTSTLLSQRRLPLTLYPSPRSYT